MRTDALSIRALIQRIADGDQQAANELVKRYWPPLHRYAQRFLNRYRLLRRVCDPSDVLQDTFLSFFRRFAAGGRFDIDSEAALLALLRTMAHNQVAKIARRYLTSAKRGLGRQVSLDAANHSADTQMNPAEVAQYKDLVEKCLIRLAEDERLLFEMRGLDQRSIAEIAQRLDSCPRTVWGRLNNLRVRIGDLRRRPLPWVLVN
jgi:RNA polymerase sigma factor (sigma-70 family)